MSEPRDTLFAAIVTQLEKIREDGGYAVTVGKVYRGVDVLPEQMNEGDFPALEVLEDIGGERWERFDQQGYLCRWPLVLAGTVRTGGSDMAAAQRHVDICRLLNAVVRALMEDATFGGTCKESEISNPVVFVDPHRPEAYFNLMLTCIYSFGRADL